MRLALVSMAFAPAGAYLAPRPWAASSRRAATTRCSATGSGGGFTVPAFTREQAHTLAAQNWVCVPNFLPTNAVASLRADVMALRREAKFKVAGVGEGKTNVVSAQIRVAETCFLLPKLAPSSGASGAAAGGLEARESLYSALDGLAADLGDQAARSGPLAGAPPLDPRLNEALYAYYPQGGFYRRHVDAAPNTASVLRTYSYLLYLTEEWQDGDAGELRIHRDAGRDECVGAPNFVDVAPRAGTLVLFRSDAVPHEVLDTAKERIAVVGWFNRRVALADASALTGGADLGKSAALVLAAGLVVAGLGMIATQ